MQVSAYSKIGRRQPCGRGLGNAANVCGIELTCPVSSRRYGYAETGANTAHSVTFSWPLKSALHSPFEMSVTRTVCKPEMSQVGRPCTARKTRWHRKMEAKPHAINSDGINHPEFAEAAQPTWSFDALTSSLESSLGMTDRTHSMWPLNVFTQYLR